MRRPTGTVRTECLKLFASFPSALSLALVATGAVRPAFETGGDPVRMLIRCIAGLAAHGVAHCVPGHLEPAAGMTLCDILVR